MSFSFKALLDGQPQDGHTIKVYETGTTNLVSGLKKLDGSSLDNPFLVSDAGSVGDWGFDAPNQEQYDTWWEEGSFLLSQKQYEIDGSFFQFKTGLGDQTGPAGKVFWQNEFYTFSIITGLGPVLQTGQEIYIFIYNDTGEEIDNLAVLRPKSAAMVGSIVVPAPELAKADKFATVEGTLMVATMVIPVDGVGLATRFGRAKGGNTLGFNPGDGLFVSDTVGGGKQNTQPQFPSYAISIGVVLNVHETEGEIFVSITRDIFDTTLNFWNGSIRENFDFITGADGFTGSLERTGGGDLTPMFSDGLYDFDCTPAKTVAMTNGTDNDPVENFVYMLKSDKILTVSTVGWPSGVEHIRIANVVLQSLATTQLLGPVVNRNWNDHIQDSINQGENSHTGWWIRSRAASWLSGCLGAIDITTNPAAPDDVFFSHATGVVLQKHEQPVGVADMAVGKQLFIANDSISPMKTTDNLNTELLDASGASMAGRFFNITIAGVNNKSGENDQIVANLPSGSYSSLDDAISDVDAYNVDDFPAYMNGTVFLIGRYTFKHSNPSSGTWELVNSVDLTGKFANTGSSGGGAFPGGASGSFTTVDGKTVTVANGLITAIV